MSEAPAARAKAREGTGVPDTLVVIPVHDQVVFPGMLSPLALKTADAELLGDYLGGERPLAVFAAPPEPTVEPHAGGILLAGDPAPAGPPLVAGGGPDVPTVTTPSGIVVPASSADPLPPLYPVGTAVDVARMLRFPDGTVRLLVQGISRIERLAFSSVTPQLVARVRALEESPQRNMEVEALARNLAGQFGKLVELVGYLPDELAVAALNIPEPERLADFVAANLRIGLVERQEVLASMGTKERLELVTRQVSHELEIQELGSKIQAEVQGEMGRNQRQFILREQLKAIQKELGEKDEQSADLDDLRKRLEEARLPEVAQKSARRELERLAQMNPASPDFNVVRTYLDWMATLPWAVSTRDRLDLAHAKGVLDADHYDLEKVKDRILEFLAVRRLRRDSRGPILCFVGPPGVGKTSLGQSIARALGRKFLRISLGGMRDEAEIRGHRRTYVGALPGRIIQQLRSAGANNPVFMLDEVDKIGADFRGDPASALLEVLDPAQNSTFEDHYLDLPFDLSKVMFITTANLLDPIPRPLLDRMEVITLAGYTDTEKLHIAQKYLVPRQRLETGLSGTGKRAKDRPAFTDQALRRIIDDYTRESGVRELERQVGGVLRKVARQVAEGGKVPSLINPKEVRSYLGPPRVFREAAEREDAVGIVSGLAVTEVGGEILFVEVVMVPGSGNVQLTGHLGEVMQESARAALTYVRSRSEAMGVGADFYQQHDVHIHVPSGAVPKDGPSAGVAMAVGVASAVTGRKVRHDLAMTGEITVHGRVMPIGGLKQKVLAAHRAGIKQVLFPAENRGDLEDIPAEVRKEMKLEPITHVDEALARALVPPIPARRIAKVAPAGTAPVAARRSPAAARH